MAFEIVHKQEFELKLKELRVLTKFNNNIVSFLKRTYEKDGKKLHQRIVDEFVQGLNKLAEFSFFCVCAFDWPDTPEGVEFWEKIGNS